MKHLEKFMINLGYKAKDKVTGFKGVISSVSFDLFGCIQCVITPEILDKDGQLKKGHWFDISRIQILSKKTVIDNPFLKCDNQSKAVIVKGKKGAAEKPAKY